MKEELISFKTAKLAKEKGFNIETKYWYDQTEVLNPTKGVRGAMVYTNEGYAPTQSLLQRWLREKHRIHISIWYNELTSKWRIDYIHKHKDKEYYDFEDDKEVYTYEEALEHGLIKGLELI